MLNAENERAPLSFSLSHFSFLPAPPRLTMLANLHRYGKSTTAMSTDLSPESRPGRGQSAHLAAAASAGQRQPRLAPRRPASRNGMDQQPPAPFPHQRCALYRSASQ